MKKFTKKQWIKFSIAAVLYTLFAIWMQNLWLLLGLIVLVDIFLTHYIPWGYLILFAEPSPSLFHHSLSLYNRLLFIA